MFVFCFQTALRRTHDEAFSDDDDDDWVFDPALDRVMDGGGAAATPLLEFDLTPIGARRNWRNVLNRGGSRLPCDNVGILLRLII